MIDTELLREYAAEYGITVSDTACQKFDRYAELLVEWNQRMNLTAITEPQDIVLKHFADSMTALSVLSEKTGLSVAYYHTASDSGGLPCVRHVSYPLQCGWR